MLSFLRQRRDDSEVQREIDRLQASRALLEEGDGDEEDYDDEEEEDEEEEEEEDQE